MEDNNGDCKVFIVLKYISSKGKVLNLFFVIDRLKFLDLVGQSAMFSAV